MIFRIMGFLMLIETLMLLCCAGIAVIYKENDLQAFLLSAGLTTSASLLFLIIGKGAEKHLSRRDGYVIVSAAWIAFSFFGMFPFILSGHVPNPTDAFFETMSGFTSEF